MAEKAVKSQKQKEEFDIKEIYTPTPNFLKSLFGVGVYAFIRGEKRNLEAEFREIFT